MIRIATTVVCALSLSACANLPDWTAARQFFEGGAARTELVQYSFDWYLTGERQVAPLQIFDDGQKTWLQFLPDQIIPAVFQHAAQGERLLSTTRQGEYLVLDGVWPALSFRGGALSASAHKQLSDSPSPDDAVHAVVAESGHDADLDVSAIPVTLDTPSSVAIQPLSRADNLPVVDANTGSDRPVENITKSDIGDAGFGTVADEVLRLTDASFEQIALHQPSYDVRLQDGNLRQALRRWATKANWTFAPEHWDVDADVPISGEAEFSGSFQDAVQDVLASTELADRPLRPCFYSNRVLRVVAYAQSCDRSGAQAS